MAFKSWSLASVTADTATDLVTPTANKDAIMLSLCIVNEDTTNTAAVKAWVSTSADAVVGQILSLDVDPGDTIHMDTKVTLPTSATPNKVRVQSDVADVSFLASGDEEAV